MSAVGACSPRRMCAHCSLLLNESGSLHSHYGLGIMSLTDSSVVGVSKGMGGKRRAKAIRTFEQVRTLGRISLFPPDPRLIMP